MGAHHDHAVAFDGMSDDYRRRLVAVILINAAMFVVEITAGQYAGSQALKADALDFFADALTYGASLAVIGMALRTRALVALAKGASLLVMGLWVLGSTIYRVSACSRLPPTLRACSSSSATRTATPMSAPSGSARGTTPSAMSR